MKKHRYEKLQDKKIKLATTIAPFLERFTKATGLIVQSIEVNPEYELRLDENFKEPKLKEETITYKITIKAGV